MNGAFEGAGGAISLSVIAFSIVFLVLLGLTAIICGIRIVVEMKSGSSKPRAASVSAPVKGQASAQFVQPPKTSGVSDEVVAAITGALVAKIGSGFRILSVKPQLCGNGDGWTSCGRFEGLEGLDRSPWATGGRS